MTEDKAKGMTVGDLITALHRLPQDLPVVVRGYEGGYDDLNLVSLPLLERDVHTRSSYMGRHGYADDIVAEESEDGKYFRAVLLDGENTLEEDARSQQGRER
jgi:hypothetical protein